MENPLITQNYDSYTEDDHNTWKILNSIHDKTIFENISSEYVKGLRLLKIDQHKIASINEVSKGLEKISGWSLIPVMGLIPTKHFFQLLSTKKYPININIRKLNEVDFSEQPDIFHDIIGHVPLLINHKFSEFLIEFSNIALKYHNNEKIIELLGRLYWYTFEMGLIKEAKNYKAYGGAIITSLQERKNVSQKTIKKKKFDVNDILNTTYNPYKLQNQYFYINSFDDLFTSLKHVEMVIKEYVDKENPELLLGNYKINKNITDNFNNVVGFLNDVGSQFPQAISFVAGKPDENFFYVKECLNKFDTYINYLSNENGNSYDINVKQVGQYNSTKGIINEILSKYLWVDEEINANKENIIVTVGAQEAFSIIVSTVSNKDTDVILIEDPSYIGLSSFSKIHDYNLVGVPVDETGLNLNSLETTINSVLDTNKIIKLLYTIPDYHNPTGSCMPVKNRLELLNLAHKYNFLIIEDSVYNNFSYYGDKAPTLKSLDKFNRVIYVNSFSKLIFPGLRLGLIVSDQKIVNESGSSTYLIDEMAKVKSQITNSTSTIDQAILAGILIDNKYTLNLHNKLKFESYKKKRDFMLLCFDKYIKPFEFSWSKDVKWNKPNGGFFIKMKVPFVVDKNSVLECASKFNVLFCPMSFFYLHAGGDYELRLTFSNLNDDEIENGVKQLSFYLQRKILNIIVE